jgi:hypothetical protein
MWYKARGARQVQIASLGRPPREACMDAIVESRCGKLRGRFSRRGSPMPSRSWSDPVRIA